MSPMKAVSLFSGVGGFEIGMERAGITTVLQAESNKWALGVLRRQFPSVPKVEDVASVTRESVADLCQGDAPPRGARGREVGGARTLADPERVRGRAEPRARFSLGSGIDLVYGGFPCQDLSVAGNRSGLAGERSGLWLEFRRVLSELRPSWALIENVPGLLSIHQGRDFAQLLLQMEELGYGWAYRVLDAQGFGVPQQRRRVFIVGRLGGGDGPAEVLSLCESCGGDPQARRKSPPHLAASVGGGAYRTGRRGEDDPNLVYAPEPGDGNRAVAHTVSNRRRNDHNQNDFVITDQSPREVAHTLSAGSNPNSNMAGRHHEDDYNLVHDLYIGAGVRRLTPRECERLQGWPDDWTRYLDTGREVADATRYRMIGNGVVATVAQWLGTRIAAIDDRDQQP